MQKYMMMQKYENISDDSNQYEEQVANDNQIQKYDDVSDYSNQSENQVVIDKQVQIYDIVPDEGNQYENQVVIDKQVQIYDIISDESNQCENQVVIDKQVQIYDIISDESNQCENQVVIDKQVQIYDIVSDESNQCEKQVANNEQMQMYEDVSDDSNQYEKQVTNDKQMPIYDIISDASNECEKQVANDKQMQIYGFVSNDSYPFEKQVAKHKRMQMHSIVSNICKRFEEQVAYDKMLVHDIAFDDSNQYKKQVSNNILIQLRDIVSDFCNQYTKQEPNDKQMQKDISFTGNPFQKLSADVTEVQKDDDVSVIGNQFQTLLADGTEMQKDYDVSVIGNQFQTLLAGGTEVQKDDDITVIGNQFQKLFSDGTEMQKDDVPVIGNQFQTLLADGTEMQKDYDVSLIGNQFQTLFAVGTEMQKDYGVSVIGNQFQTILAGVTQIYENISDISNQSEKQDIKMQGYDNISDISNPSEKQVTDYKEDEFKWSEMECFSEEGSQCSESPSQLSLSTEKNPALFYYNLEYPVDPPEYIEGFQMPIPEGYCFEAMFPKIYRRLCVPPPGIPPVILFWTLRNPGVLNLLMGKIACVSIRNVVESLKHERAIIILFWKSALASLFGCHDVANLLRAAIYRLIENDFECTFYLYIAAMNRIAEKQARISKSKIKYKDKDFGLVNYELKVIQIRKHIRVDRNIRKLKPMWKHCILRNKSLIKKPFHFKDTHIKNLFKKTKESAKLVKFKTPPKELPKSAEQIAESLAHSIANSDFGDSSTDADFEYANLLHEFDYNFLEENILSILQDEFRHGRSNIPAPDLKEEFEENMDMCSKVVNIKFHSKPCLEKTVEHSWYCVESLMNPEISSLTHRILNCVLKPSLGHQFLHISIDCINAEVIREVLGNVIEGLLKSQFDSVSENNPILEFPLKYIEIDLHFLVQILNYKRILNNKRICDKEEREEESDENCCDD